jgi:hypothetical protein
VIEDLHFESKLEQYVIAGPDMLTRIAAIILSRCKWDDVYMIYEDFFLKLVRTAGEIVARWKTRRSSIEDDITRAMMKNSVAVIMLDMMAVICKANNLNENDIKNHSIRASKFGKIRIWPMHCTIHPRTGSLSSKCLKA